MALPVLFLPGMMCDARLFEPQIAMLSAHYSVMVHHIGRHRDITSIAANILANSPERFALAGLSMGGIVAMEVVRQAPDRVDKLALLDTNPRAELEKVKAGRTPQMDAIRNGHLDDVMRDHMIPKYFVETTEQQPLIDLCMDMARAMGPEVFINQSLALRDRPDQQETLRHYHGLTLVLCGRHDRLCPLERHELMHELLPNSQLEIVEDAGHLPTLEQPNATTAALVRWLEQT